MSGLEMCRALGIDFVSVTESIDTSLPSGELVFQMIGAVAQFERSLIGERVKSGLANARARGKALGRPSLRKLSPAEPVSSDKSEYGRTFLSESSPGGSAYQCGPPTDCALATLKNCKCKGCHAVTSQNSCAA
jgi:DNA invertase Pin-like site-specific DNA recombinase